MITLDQVHENNIVAKQWANLLCAEIKKLRTARAEHEALPFSKRIAYEMMNAQTLSMEMYLLHKLEYALMDLTLYFKFHYKEAALLSKLRSPELSFSTTSEVLIRAIHDTYNFESVPHEVKDA